MMKNSNNTNIADTAHRNAGFFKIKRNLLSLSDMQGILDEGGSTALGTWLIIMLHLSNCENCVCSMSQRELNAIAAEAKKRTPYIIRIIVESGLFVIVGSGNSKFFYSASLCKAMKVDLKTAGCCVADEQQMNGRSSCNQQLAPMHNKNVQAQAGRDKDIDKDKDKEYSPTASANRKDAAIANADSISLLLDKSFMNSEWVCSVQNICRLQLQGNAALQGSCRKWFLLQCAAKQKAFRDERDALSYFCNLFQPGRKTREAFDDFLARQRSGGSGDNGGTAEYFDTARHGKRYDSNGVHLPPDAPRQTDLHCIWSYCHGEYVSLDNYDRKAEAEAFRKYCGEYRKKHRK